MLITFTTEHGELVIRAEDLRRLQDVARFSVEGKTGEVYCLVEWSPVSGELRSCEVFGTAADNRARIVAEETKLIAAYEAAQRMAQVPVERGRVKR